MQGQPRKHIVDFRRGVKTPQPKFGFQVEDSVNNLARKILQQYRKLFSRYLNQYRNVEIKMKVESQVSLNTEVYSYASMASSGTVRANKAQ